VRACRSWAGAHQLSHRLQLACRAQRGADGSDAAHSGAHSARGGGVGGGIL
jgi:hypothetical protein